MSNRPGALPDIQAAISARREQRATASTHRKELVDSLKNQGNQLFKVKDYVGAVTLYVQAIDICGPKPVLMSNLAAGYLKLELYELAEWAATKALIYDPRMIKARYRRAVARHEMKQLTAAIADLHIILKKDPECKEAQVLLKGVTASHDSSKIVEDERPFDEQEWPDCDEDACEFSSESDSSECMHVGNGIACRFYNHDGCSRGDQCNYSHAPDDKSVRDELGKNVCLFYLLETCKFGPARCVYSHTKAYLPSRGWWNNPDQVMGAKFYAKLMEEEKKDQRSFNSLIRQRGGGKAYAGRWGRDLVIDHIRLNGDPAKGLKSKAASSTTASSAPTCLVLLISLENEFFNSIHAHFLNTLRAKAVVVQALTMTDALTHLASPDLVGVFVTDPGIVRRKNAPVVAKLVEFVKRGGSAVVGGCFSTFVGGQEMDNFLRKAWGLPWKRGSYHRTTFTTHSTNDIVKRNPSLIPSYSMKALHVTGISSQDAIYKPTRDSRLESRVFAPSQISDLDESPAVSRRIEKGYFGYIGDVNGENESTNTVLAMLGLLDTPNITPVSSSEAGPSQNTVATDKLDRKAKPSTASPKPSTSTSKKSLTIAGNATLAAFTNRFVLLISLGDDALFSRVHGHQVTALRTRADVKQAVTAAQAIQLLASPDLAGVYVTDEAIADASHKLLLIHIVKYAQSGGAVVIGGLFSSFIHLDKMDKFFASVGLGCWKRGSYTRSTICLVASHFTAIANPSLPTSYSMKAVQLKSNLPGPAIYQLEEDVDSDADMLGPGEVFASDIGKEFESPVMQVRLRQGYFGYIGDVNAEHGTTDVLLAMLNLLRLPRRRVERPARKFILVVSLQETKQFDQEYANFFESIRHNVEVLHGLSSERAVDLLSSPDLAGVLILSPGIVKYDNIYLLSKLIEFSKAGGTTVFAGKFNECNAQELGHFFSDAWGLSWQVTFAFMSDIALNKHHEIAKKNPSLPLSLHRKSMCIQGVTDNMALYTTQQTVPFSSTFHAPIIYTPIGKGNIGYIGTSDLKEDEKNIVLALFRL